MGPRALAIALALACDYTSDDAAMLLTEAAPNAIGALYGLPQTASGGAKPPGGPTLPPSLEAMAEPAAGLSYTVATLHARNSQTDTQSCLCVFGCRCKLWANTGPRFQQASLARVVMPAMAQTHAL